MDISLHAFVDELTKIAVRVPFIHGTNAEWDVLRPGVGDTILKSDPNARAVYTTVKSRHKMPGISTFARAAAESKGGEPTIAFGKMDTKKGWEPFQLTQKGRKLFEGEIDEARDIVRRLDAGGLSKAERGKLWRTLHETVGAWRNKDLGAVLKPKYYKRVASLLASKGRKAA